MNARRTFLTVSGGLVAAGVARAAFAQTLSDTAMSATDWKTMTLMAGGFSKMTSDLALTRAANPRVKQFAGFESAEQMTIAQVITDMTEPTPLPLDAEHQAMLDRLAATNGPGFDRSYVMGQIEGHEALLRIQQGYLDSKQREPDLQHVALLARTSIQQHLTMLADLRTVIGA